MTAIQFLHGGRLWLLVVVAMLGAGYIAALRWRRRATVRFTQVDLLDRIAPARPAWRRHVVAALQLAGLGLGVVAIARPVERTTERTESEGRILVLFDVSLSMMATDVEPDRIEAAKEAARAFVDQVDPSVEVGLVSFSGRVTVEIPPTLNRGRLERGIEGLELAESTAIGDALDTGAELLEQLADDGDGDPDGGDSDGGSDDRGDGSNGADDELAPGAIVLLSDGETTVGIETAEGAQVAADAGIPVFTIAFGTLEGTITDPLSGDVISVAVQPEPLADVAEVTGGAAYEAATEAELSEAYELIQESLGDTLGEEIEVVTEQTWKWAAAAMLVLAVAWALSLWWLRGLV